jgi:hypothetical protein
LSFKLQEGQLHLLHETLEGLRNESSKLEQLQSEESSSSEQYNKAKSLLQLCSIVLDEILV